MVAEWRSPQNGGDFARQDFDPDKASETKILGTRRISWVGQPYCSSIWEESEQSNFHIKHSDFTVVASENGAFWAFLAVYWLLELFLCVATTLCTHFGEAENTSMTCAELRMSGMGSIVSH